MHFAIQVLLLVGVISKASAECANGCSGNGKCGIFDSCICEKNYESNDCSQRSCPVGNAHVDSAKGDLDGDSFISNSDKTVVINSNSWPYGTEEGGPRAMDSDLNVIMNTGHEYMICSNKGTCNTESGLCECMSGYEGNACQRAGCPNNCNNKGTCQTIEQIAKISGATYKLWNKETTMGCVCDPGYSGPDCSLRKCKFGVDPLYFDDVATQKLTTMKMFMGTTRNETYTSDKLFNDGTVAKNDGIFRLTFTDKLGETFTTSKLTDGATCNDIVLALEQLPNDVVPSGSIVCSEFRVFNNSLANLTTDWQADWEDTIHSTAAIAAGLFGHERYNKVEFFTLDMWSAQQGYGWLNQNFPATIRNFNTNDYLAHRLDGQIYELVFTMPGDIPELIIELYTDGAFPTLVAANEDPRKIDLQENLGAVITAVWMDGEIGEDKDYFADHCDGVVVNIDAFNGKLLMTAAEETKLKRCIADADGDWTNQPSIDNFDFGDEYNLHMVKIVKSNTYHNDGGFYLAIKWDASDGFLIINNFAPLEYAATGLDGQYEVFTTQGILEMVSSFTDVITSVGKSDIVTMNYAFDNRTNTSTGLSQWSGDLSCEVTSHDAPGKFGDFIRTPFSSSMGTSMCLSPGDIIVFLNPHNRGANTKYINMYTVEALTQKIPISSFQSDGFEGKLASGLGVNMIKLDHALNFGHVPTRMNKNEQMFIYKFTPGVASTYEVVAPCSNRGICDETSGICKCFLGYGGDACDLQTVVTC